MRFIGVVIVVASLISTFLLPIALGFLQLAAYGTDLTSKTALEAAVLVPAALSIGGSFYLSPMGAGFLGLDYLFFLIGALLIVNNPDQSTAADKPTL